MKSPSAGLTYNLDFSDGDCEVESIVTIQMAFQGPTHIAGLGASDGDERSRNIIQLQTLYTMVMLKERAYMGHDKCLLISSQGDLEFGY